MINRNFLYSLLDSLFLLVISLVVSVYAAGYANREFSNSVTDIVLSNTRVYNVDWFLIYGVFIFWVAVTLVLIKYPKRLNFFLKSLALFILVRSLFITLTHIAPFPVHFIVQPVDFLADILGNKLFYMFFISGGFFFSGHTGTPFLVALIFWDIRILRILFIGFSIIFGTVMLLGHLHYSIDVVAAFFITYSIFKISESIFKKDLI